ncbi:hypothetical protein [Methanosphaerula palustris]|uniref:hypothetical protein n=1 Tax=Methanosphaerula palustris TaxID=475088 RepID=UPI0011D0E2A2|nr:hypothetical protein [Methanosphaerula palustris]
MSDRDRDLGSESNRGLASADPETRARVARMGGYAPHRERGLQAASPETRERVARMGGVASHGGQPTGSAERVSSMRPIPSGPDLGPLDRDRRAARSRKQSPGT